MKIAIRVDGSLFIGLGHVVRSLALGNAFRRAGHEVVFFSRFEPGISRLLSQGFPVEAFRGGLPDGPGKEYEPACDGELVAKLLTGRGFDCLVTDSYRVDAAYFSTVRMVVPISVCVDDLNRFPVDVDGIINGNINAESLGYEVWPAKAKRWLGCRYNLLREEFRELPLLPTGAVARQVLLTGGGGDSGPVLAFLAQSLLDSAALSALRLQIVAPARSLADSDLTFLSERYPERLQVQRDVKDMVPLMRQCDLAISAGGTTLYELCAAGVPRIAYILADNQRDIVEAMARQGQVVNLGTVALLKPATVVGETAAMAADREKRERMRRMGRELVDGWGADRVVAGITELVAVGRRRGK